jgi:NADH-quinone oxidoreductase subunit C
MTTVELRPVTIEDWRTEVAALREAGYAYLDLLTAVDRVDSRELVVHLVDPDTGRRALVSTRLPAADPRVSSIAGILPAATWHEREVAEMFGVVFDGHPDPRPLLLRATTTQPPLLATVPLPERLATPWPGAAEAGEGRRSRRPQPPPGVRDTWATVEAAEDRS